MKFCIWIDHQTFSSNMKKYFYKVNNFIENDVIILRICRLSKIHKTKKNIKNTGNSVINSHIIVKFCEGVAHDKTIAHTEQNSEICTDVMLLKFELNMAKISRMIN